LRKDFAAALTERDVAAQDLRKEVAGVYELEHRTSKTEHSARPLSADTPVKLDITSVLLVVGSLVDFGAGGAMWINGQIAARGPGRQTGLREARSACGGREQSRCWARQDGRRAQGASGRHGQGQRPQVHHHHYALAAGATEKPLTETAQARTWALSLGPLSLAGAAIATRPASTSPGIRKNRRHT
jgi:hypothetical protein